MAEARTAEAVEEESHAASMCHSTDKCQYNVNR